MNDLRTGDQLVLSEVLESAKIALDELNYLAFKDVDTSTIREQLTYIRNIVTSQLAPLG